MNKKIFAGLQKTVQALKLYKLAFFSTLYDNACWLKRKPKVVILGSSFAMTSIIPKQISLLNPEYKTEEIINLGQSMGGPYEMYLSLRKHLKMLNEMEYVYISIDPHILGEKFFHYMSIEKQFVSAEQWDYMFSHHEKYMQKYHSHIKIESFSPLYFVKEMFSQKCKKHHVFNGYEPRYHVNIKPFKPKDIALYTFEPQELFPVSSFSFSYLVKVKELIQGCSRAKIRYLLSPSYDWQEGYAQYCKSYDDDLMKALQENLDDIDIVGSLYKNDFKLKHYDFYDNRHLSHSGAMKYTTAVFEEMTKRSLYHKETNLYNYRLDFRPSSSLYSLLDNMKVLEKQLDDYVGNKEKVVLFGLTNMSRCIMSLLGEITVRTVVCDTSLFLGTAPEFLRDDFIYSKKLIPFNKLNTQEYDAYILCNFMRWDEDYRQLLENDVNKDKIFHLNTKIFDRQYFHIQINMLFSIMDYIKKTFSQCYLVEESILLVFMKNILQKSLKVEMISRSEALEMKDFNTNENIAFVLGSEDEVLENHLQEECALGFENIITLAL